MRPGTCGSLRRLAIISGSVRQSPEDQGGSSLSGYVRAGDCVSAMPCPVGVEEFSARTVGTLIGMGAEEVTLGLKQVGREPLAAVAVVVFKCGEQSRSGNAVLEGFGKD